MLRDLEAGGPVALPRARAREAGHRPAGRTTAPAGGHVSRVRMATVSRIFVAVRRVIGELAVTPAALAMPGARTSMPDIGRNGAALRSGIPTCLSSGPSGAARPGRAFARPMAPRV